MSKGKEKEVKKETKSAEISAPLVKYVFVRDYELFISVRPNVKKHFKKGDEVTDKELVSRVKSILPVVIEAVG